MSSNLYVAVSGAMARLRELDVVANNLANVDTTGFKRDGTLFESTLESALQDRGGDRVPGAPGRAFVTARGARTDLGQGGIAMTGGPLDVAIEGSGFFEVQAPNGPRYTRAGSFLVDASKRIATPDGMPLASEGGSLTVGDRPVRILASGSVVDDQDQEIGRLKVVEFPAGVALEKDGDNLFRAPQGAAPRTLEQPRLVEGAVERSNVEPVRELAALVLLHRAFDVALQVLKSEDSATERLIREVS